MLENGPLNLLFVCVFGLFFIDSGTGHANNKKQDVCNPQFAKIGIELCEDAFERAFNINRDSVLSSPKRHGCCISQNIAKCFIFSYTAANCQPAEFKVPELIEAKQRDLQLRVNKEANYLGNANCGYLSWEKCAHLVHEYGKTIYNISDMNNPKNQGAKTVSLSVLAFTTLLLRNTAVKNGLG